MAQQQYAKPLPTPSPETARYWQGCRSHELWLPFCPSCQAFFFYPRSFCPKCFGWDVEWRQVSGRGTLYSYAIQYRAFHPAWAQDTPYVTAIVQLDEGPRIYTTLTGVQPDPNSLRCDMPLEAVFDDISEEITLPRFRPMVDGASSARPQPASPERSRRVERRRK